MAAAEHCSGDAGHDGLSLYVQVPAHLIRFPPSDETNAVAINASVEKGHGLPPARVERAETSEGAKPRSGEERVERRT